MKIRHGFVSNSSTSSFCIYGCSVDKYEILDILSATVEQKEQAEEEGVSEILYEILSETDIEHWSPYDWDQVFLGFTFTHIPDDVVVGEWKKAKKEILKKLLGDNIDCAVIMEAFAN